MVSSSTRSDLTKKENAWILVCLVFSEAVHTCLAEDKPYCDTSTNCECSMFSTLELYLGKISSQDGNRLFPQWRVFPTEAF